MTNMNITEEPNLNLVSKMRSLVIIFLLIFSFELFSQTKAAPEFYASLDCANSSKQITKKNLAKCSKLVLLGPDAENHSIIFAVISFKVGEMIKEFPVRDGVLSEETQEQILKTTSGSYFYLEHVRVKHNSSELANTLPVSKIKVIAN